MVSVNQSVPKGHSNQQNKAKEEHLRAQARKEVSAEQLCSALLGNQQDWVPHCNASHAHNTGDSQKSVHS